MNTDNTEKEITGYSSIDRPWLKYYTDEVINAEMPKQTIYQYLKTKNINNINKVAIDYFGNRFTYGQLFSKIDQCADLLCSVGVSKGDIVSICMPTTPEVIYLFYALSKIGAISNMIDPRKSAKEIAEYIQEVNSDIFFCIDVIREKLVIINEVNCLKHIVVVTPYESFKAPLKQILIWKDSMGKNKVSKEISWSKFLGIKKLCSEECQYEEDKAVTIVRTGGTTGKSKGVILSNDNINCGAYQCEISGLDFKDRGTWLDIMPPFIVYGVGNGLHLPLSMGMKVILIPKFNPQEFDKILLKYRPNYMAGVPSHWSYLLNSKKLKNIDLSFIKTPIVGGDKMDYTLEVEVNAFLKEHNCSAKIIKGYGMSEVDAAVSVCTNNMTNKLQSVGIPLSHSIIEICNPETGERMPANQMGEVRIAGPNVMIGYFGNEQETKLVLKTDENGVAWIYSGDMGYMDEDGVLFVKGRYKEMIIRPDGFKVYPSSIEETILLHKAVSECKVVGIRDNAESQGELPKAYIILKDEAEICASKERIVQEIKDLCKKELAEYSQPVEYQIINSFPVTPIGKIDTLKLKNL